jgi:hypothetical protein
LHITDLHRSKPARITKFQLSVLPIETLRSQIMQQRSDAIHTRLRTAAATRMSVEDLDVWMANVTVEMNVPEILQLIEEAI